ncbi:MAG: tetratricopeptide repeat protein [Bacteroidota bacterium]
MKRTAIICLFLLFAAWSHGQDSASVLMRKASLKIDAKDYKGAITLLNSAISLDSGDPDAYAFRGQAKHNLNDLNGALADYNKAIELMPNYAEVYHLRGMVKGDLKDQKGACEDWEKAYEYGYKKALELLSKFCNDVMDPKK